MEFIPKKILVTGGAGFIGSNFTYHMLSKYDDLKLYTFDKLTYAGSMSNLDNVMADQRHSFICADICDRTALRKVLREYKIDTIVHFAAESHVDNSIESPEIFFKNNTMGTFYLVDEAKKYWLDEMSWGSDKCRFHHVSTDEVYGSLDLGDDAFTESTPYAPNSPYASSKAASDHIVRAYYKTYNLPATQSNCSNNFGPNQHREKLIPKIIGQLMNGKKISIYGNGMNIRDWLYVVDHCVAIDTIIRYSKVGEVYNIGTNNEMTNMILVEKIYLILRKLDVVRKDLGQLIEYVDDRKGHDYRYAINTSKIKKELGWESSFSLENCLEKTVKHILDCQMVS